MLINQNAISRTFPSGRNHKRKIVYSNKMIFNEKKMDKWDLWNEIRDDGDKASFIKFDTHIFEQLNNAKHVDLSCECGRRTAHTKCLLVIHCIFTAAIWIRWQWSWLDCDVGYADVARMCVLDWWLSPWPDHRFFSLSHGHDTYFGNMHIASWLSRWICHHVWNACRRSKVPRHPVERARNEPARRSCYLQARKRHGIRILRWHHKENSQASCNTIVGFVHIVVRMLSTVS